MASISRKRMLLLLFLISDGAGNTMANKCKDLASTKSIPVVSFCNEQYLDLNSPITLDAYQPSFGASVSICMCEVKILSTQSFSSLRISQESTLVPPEDCGLQIKIANATDIIRTVKKCSYTGNTEYILHQGSSIVISLANVSETWSEGFCFHLSLRFENSPISVQCFNPDITITPAQPYTTDTPTTATTASSVTTSTVTSHVTSNVKSSTSTSGTVSSGTTQTEFSQTTATSTSYSTSSGKVFFSTFTNTEKVESTTGVGTGTTILVRTSSVGKEDVTSNVKKVIHTSDFNVLYAVIPVIGVILIGILCLVFIWYRRRRDAKDRLYSRERLQTSTASSSNGTDTHPQNKAYRETHTANPIKKNDPEFYYYDDQPTQQTALYATVYKGATSKENNPKRTSHYVRKKEGKDISRSDLGVDQTARNSSRGSSNDNSVVYVTVNGGKRFIL